MKELANIKRLYDSKDESNKSLAIELFLGLGWYEQGNKFYMYIFDFKELYESLCFTRKLMFNEKIIKVNPNFFTEFLDELASYDPLTIIKARFINGLEKKKKTCFMVKEIMRETKDPTFTLQQALDLVNTW